jgi:YVTN family beta-propeller protein
MLEKVFSTAVKKKIFLISCFCSLCISLQARVDEYSAVAIVNSSSYELLKTLVTGDTPIGIVNSNSPYSIAITPDHSKVFTASYSSQNVAVIDAANNAVLTTIPIDGFPFFIAIDPSGTKAFVTDIGGRSIFVIDTATYELLNTISLPNNAPSFIVFTPDGSKAFVGYSGLISSTSVSVIDTSTYGILTNLSLGDTTQFIAITPDGSKAFAAVGDTVYVIDANSYATLDTLDFHASFIVVTQDGTKAFMALPEDNIVNVIDAASYALLSAVPVGSAPNSDESIAFVSNLDSNNLSVINTTTYEVSTPLSGLNGPFSMAITPNGLTLFILNQNANSLSAVDAASYELIETISIQNNPYAMVVGTNKLFVAQETRVFLPMKAKFKKAKGAGIKFGYYQLSWPAFSAKAVYKIFRNGIFISQVKNTTQYSDLRIDPSKVYTYEVIAYSSEGVQLGEVGQITVGPQ